jgi:hypothetical protein
MRRSRRPDGKRLSPVDRALCVVVPAKAGTRLFWKFWHRQDQTLGPGLRRDDGIGFFRVEHQEGRAEVDLPPALVMAPTPTLPRDAGEGVSALREWGEVAG